MANFRETMNRELKRSLKNERFRDTTIEKKDLLEYLYIIKEDLKIFHQTVGDMSIKDLGRVQALVSAINDKKMLGVDIYKQYLKDLSGKAASAEKESIFSSLIFACKKSEKVLEELIEIYSDINQKTLITIGNLSASDTMVFGAMRRIDGIAQFSYFLFSAVSTNITSPTMSVPGYRIAKMKEIGTTVALDISKLYMGAGIANTSRNFKQVAEDDNDVKLLNSKFIPSCQFIGNLVPDSIANLLTGIFNINIFRYVGESWLQYRESYYRKQEDERAWLRDHVNVLRVEVSTDEPSKKEKDRLLKIISKYDAKISKLDREISNYRDGE